MNPCSPPRHKDTKNPLAEHSMRMAERVIALLEILLLSGILTQSAAIGLLYSFGLIDTAGEFTARGLFLLTAADTILILLLVGLLQWKRGGLVEPFGLSP